MKTTTAPNILTTLVRQLSGTTYRIVFEARQSALLPAYPPELAAVLRGALHTAVAHLYCNGRRPGGGKPCQRCNCLFGTLLEPQMPPDHPDARRFRNPPPPYRLSVVTDRRWFSPGDRLTFECTLLGAVNEQIKSLILAWQWMAWNNLGQKPGSFRLSSVHARSWEKPDKSASYPVLENTTWYDGPLPGSINFLALPETDRVELFFSSLTVIRQKGHTVLLPSFTLLVERLWQRASLLVSLYGQTIGELHELPEYLRQFAARVKAEPVDLKIGHWEKKQHHRHRRTNHHHRHQITGIRGTIRYFGPELSGFIPLLLLGQDIGVGKYIPFGMGRFMVRY